MSKLCLECLDFYMWYPSRKNAENREPTLPVLGITNRDICRRIYYLIGETDTKNIDIDYIIEKYNPGMIVETRKGYHFYFTDIKSNNPLKVVHYGLKHYKFLDKHHLRIALWRYRVSGRRESAFLVLRVSPKYRIPDMKIIHYSNEENNKWLSQVKKLILFFSH